MTSDAAGRDLLEAIEAGDDERAVRLVREQPELAGARGADGLSAVLAALYRGKGDLVRALLDAGPELDVFEAAAVGDVARLRTLVDEDPSLATAWSADGFTALHFASFFGHPEAAALVIERGADLEARSTNEQFAFDARPLHSAAAGRNRDVCEVLLDAGADVNAVQHGGYTALIDAAQAGDEGLADLLLGRGADASARLDDGRGASDLAAAAERPKLAERLRQAAAE
jgi:ankyrin repeat protein